MYKLAVFDLDGTLLNTLDDLASSVNFALRECGYPERTTNEVKAFIGNGVRMLMHRAVPEGIGYEAYRKCFHKFRRHYLEHMKDTTAPYDNVIEMLTALQGKGVKIAVVSNKLDSAVKQLCKDYFGELVEDPRGAQGEYDRKPNPKNLLDTMSNFSFSPEQTIYIGDSDVDVETAHNANVRCIGVTWGFRDKEQLVSCGCDFVCDTCKEVLKTITE